jgi:hypothetical protein
MRAAWSPQPAGDYRPGQVGDGHLRRSRPERRLSGCVLRGTVPRASVRAGAPGHGCVVGKEWCRRRLCFGGGRTLRSLQRLLLPLPFSAEAHIITEVAGSCARSFCDLVLGSSIPFVRPDRCLMDGPAGHSRPRACSPRVSCCVTGVGSNFRATDGYLHAMRVSIYR